MMEPYSPSSFPPVAVTADLVLLTVRENRLCALLIRRGVEPFKGRLALPGGFVRPNEDLDEAAWRELREETGLDPRSVHLEQLATYGTPRRDPRMRVVTVAYLAMAPDLPIPAAGGDAAGASWLPVDDVLAHPRRLAFDHSAILGDGVERARSKLEYTSLGAAFCPPEFTVAELRHVYEIVWGQPLDPRNFHRKVTGMPQFLESTGRMTSGDGGRPAQLYRKGTAALLHPAMLRSS
jgi:8-oxo-dGTP diphosphatase